MTSCPKNHDACDGASGRCLYPNGETQGERERRLVAEALATERAAREQAEKDLAELRAICRALAEDRDAKTEELRKLRAR